MYENVKNDSQWSLICFSENVEQLFDKNSKRRNVIMEIGAMLDSTDITSVVDQTVAEIVAFFRWDDLP